MKKEEKAFVKMKKKWSRIDEERENVEVRRWWTSHHRINFSWGYQKRKKCYEELNVNNPHDKYSYTYNCDTAQGK